MSSGQANAEICRDGTAPTLNCLHEAPVIAGTISASGAGTQRTGNARAEADMLVAIQERAVCENPDAGPDGAGFRTDGQAYTLEARSVPQAVAWWPPEVADPISASEGKTYPHEGTTFRTHNVVPVPFDTTQITSAVNRSNPQPGDPCHPLAAGAHPPAVVFQPRIGRNGRGYSEDVVPALNGADAGATSDMRPCVAFTASEQANSYAWERDVYPTLPAQVPNDSSNIQQGIRIGSAVRRLTPRECERLQGFPDDFTLVPHRGKPMADGPRYKMLGNSMAVPVVRWIGERIAAVDAIAEQQDAA